MDHLPSYDELPVAAGAPAGSSWGLWGSDDVLGCLNLLTPECAVRGAACVARGTVFRLDPDLGVPDPPLFGRSALRQEVLASSPISRDDVLHDWNTQASSQWDGFRHMHHPEHGPYNGIADAHHGVHHWARRGIVGRGVLADVARWREAVDRPLKPDAPDPIEPDDLLATLDAQGTRVEAGDVLVIRTGWLGWYRTQDAAGREATAADLACCGLRAGEDTARTLWDLHIAAVAADNPALEAWPVAERDVEAFLHFRLLPLLGLPIGELWDLDALADACAADGVYEFLFTSAPLSVTGGVGSPPNALAIR